MSVERQMKPPANTTNSMRAKMHPSPTPQRASTKVDVFLIEKEDEGD